MSKARINPDIQKERDAATFDVEDMANLLNGGPEARAKNKILADAIENDKNFAGPDFAFLSRNEKYEEGMRTSALAIKKREQLGTLIGDHRDMMELNLNVNKKNPNVFFDLHYGMFVPTLMGQGTSEQQAQWLIPAMNHEILGTYAQTELGHGTFLRGLETTATYDPHTQEFVLNSPTVSSTKWWPGTLGKTANCCIVMAQLYTRCECYGIHAFVMRVRSEHDHTSLPGITLGDIGPKFGYDANDNGFMRFDNVRIPRENMLMKYARVEPDGTYIKPPKKTLSYGTMTLVRSFIVKESARGIAHACTIAIRYSAVRRQSELRPGEPEPQILTYPTQQYKLFPLLATSYAFVFVERLMMKAYGTVNAEINAGNFSNSQELHALSSGLKAFTSSTANTGIEVCRLSCGGHGYSLASGLPQLYTNFTPNCTYEGENTVLMLQAGRYLMKCCREVSEGKKLPSFTQYLAQPIPKINGVKTLKDFNHLLALYCARAYGQINFAFSEMRKYEAHGEDLVGALNHVSVHLVRATNAHLHYYVLKTFIEGVEEVQMQPKTRAVLHDLIHLYAIDGISKNSGEFLESDVLTNSDVKNAHQLVVELLPKIRVNAVTLVDAFEISDRVLNSVLGRYDGNVYENMLKWAQQSPLNNTDVHPVYEKYIKPVLKGEHISSKL